MKNNRGSVTLVVVAIIAMLGSIPISIISVRNERRLEATMTSEQVAQHRLNRAIAKLEYEAAVIRMHAHARRYTTRR